jgi:hypothetical protein
MANARDLRGGEPVLLESAPGGLPAELSGNPRVNAVLNQLEEEMMCPGCHKESGKSHCAGCGIVSYCGTFVQCHQDLIELVCERPRTPRRRPKTLFEYVAAPC